MNNAIFDRYLSLSGKIKEDPEATEEFLKLMEEGKVYFTKMMTGEDVDMDKLSARFDEVNAYLDAKFGESFKEWSVDEVIEAMMQAFMAGGQSDS